MKGRMGEDLASTALAPDRIAKSWRLDAHEIETFEKLINENCA